MIVVDSSAVLAVIFEQPGAEFVIERGRGGAISAVNHCEVVSRLVERGFQPEQIRRGVSRLGLEVFPFDRDQAQRAGVLRGPTLTLGLSLGDRACLALAQRLRAPVLTGDRRWAELDIGIEIELIR